VEVATRLVDSEGVDALSMRRLAAELGVGTMTLYGYFRDKEELLDAIVDAAADEIRLPAARGSWQTQIKGIAREIRDALERHPEGIRIRLARPMLTPGALRTTEAAMRILRAAGFDRAEAARGYRTVFLYTFAFAAFTPPGPPAKARQRSFAALPALPPKEFPEIHDAIAELADSMAGDEQFEHGLDLILDGLQARRAP
jgi:AcrR family transcriptional regulator